MTRPIRSVPVMIIACVTISLASAAHAQPAKTDAPKPSPPTPASESAPAATLPKVSILRLQVIKPDPVGANNVNAFNRRRVIGLPDPARVGTSISFLIEADPGQWILRIEPNSSKVVTFHDDKNTDLNVAGPALEPNQPRPFAQRPPGPFMQPVGPVECTLTTELDSSGHQAIVTVHSPQFPTTGAKTIQLEAELVMTHAIGSKTVEQKNVNLKSDIITVGRTPMLIMGQSTENDALQPQDGMQVTIAHHGPLNGLSNFTFIGPDGDQIPTRGTGSSQTNSIHMTQYFLSKHVDFCTIRLTVPAKIETTTLEVAINTGLGFPPTVRRRITTRPDPSAKTP